MAVTLFVGGLSCGIRCKSSERRETNKLDKAFAEKTKIKIPQKYCVGVINRGEYGFNNVIMCCVNPSNVGQNLASNSGEQSKQNL